MRDFEGILLFFSKEQIGKLLSGHRPEQQEQEQEEETAGPRQGRKDREEKLPGPSVEQPVSNPPKDVEV